jgi:hypothetical protein
MAKSVEVKSVAVSGEDKKGNPVFEAQGSLGGQEFVARTIQYNGEPIFKLQEDGSHRKMSASKFGRGDRIAVARACKAMRLQLFGEGAKAKVEPELATGETTELKAS